MLFLNNFFQHWTFQDFVKYGSYYPFLTHLPLIKYKNISIISNNQKEILNDSRLTLKIKLNKGKSILLLFYMIFF